MNGQYIEAVAYPNSSMGLSNGSVLMVNRTQYVGEAGEPLFERIEAGQELQEGTGSVHLVGMSHGKDGTVTVWIDGIPVPASGPSAYGSKRSWSRIGGCMDGNGYYGPNMRFAGTLGAVVVLPYAIDDAMAARVHKWAQGRFDVP